ncbi:MFS transporter [Sphingobium fuliginis]
MFAFDIGYWGFTTWLPTYLVKARGFSMLEMGLASSLPFFAATVGCLVGGVVSDKYFSDNRRVPIIVTELLAALLLYLTFVSNSVAMLVICQTLAGFCLSFFASAFWALPMNTVPKSMMGLVSGLINMAGQVAALISPLLVGYLVDTAGGGFGPAFGLLAGSMLVSCAVVFTLPGRSKGEHPTQAARHLT